MQITFSILTLLFIIVSVALVLIVLVQRPQGGGLTGAFGGGAGTDTAFGGRTGDALTVMTIAAFTIYLLVAIGLNITSNMMIRAAAEPAANSAPASAPAPTDAPAGANTGTGAAPEQAIPLSPEEVKQLISDTQPASANAPVSTEPAPANPAPTTPPSGGG